MTEETAPSPNFKEELQSMQIIGEAMEPLSQASRDRVLQWAIGHFAPTIRVANLNLNSAPRTVLHAANPPQEAAVAPTDLPSLFDAAAPKTQADKALVVGYWMQELQENQDFVSQDVNNELKHLGHGVANITDALSGLIEQRLVIQVRKSGTAKQARKKYKITREGVKRVQKMLDGVTEETEA